MAEERFDWKSIELPKDIDYDQLYDQLKADPEILDKLVRQILSTDQKWLEIEKMLNDKRQRRQQMMAEIKLIEDNDNRFDQMVKDLNQSIITAKTTTITDTLYYDNEYTYYSDPIQRVIDIDELRKRLSKIDVCQPSTSGQNNITENAMSVKSEMPSDETQTEDDDIMELSVVFQGTKNPIKKRSFQPFHRTLPRVGDKVLAASNAILTHCWKPGTITRIINMFNVSVQFDDRSIVGGNILMNRLIAYNKITNNPILVGERVVAYLDESNAFITKRELYSGTIAEPARNTNDYRYLIFFDKHSYRYVKREDIFYIYDKQMIDKIFGEKDQLSDVEVYEYVEFLKNYFKNYPERPMLRLQMGDNRIKVRYQKRWETAKILEIDASLALVNFEKLERPHSEWIYRGSRRLNDIYKECQITKSNVKHRALRSTTRMTRRTDDRNAFVEWNTAEEENNRDRSESQSEEEIKFITAEDVCRKRKLKQTARKSTAKPSQAGASCNASNMIANLLGDPIEIEVTQLPDLSQVRPKQFIVHICSNDCINADAESQNYYDKNPFYVPITVGYRREIIRTNEKKTRIVYRTPCGRRLRDIFEVWKFLQVTDSMLDIDLFTFSTGFSLFRASNPLKAYFHVNDITNGEERQPISCVNTIDSTDLGPVSYKAERFPHPDVTFEPDPDFLSCCDCTDNCQNAELCSCQQLTLEASDAVRMSKYQVFGYEYKRLNDFVMTGVFECNQKCRCNQRCSNRVVQNGINCRLQLFKTLKKGWGVRVLHDVPKGTFLCIYAAQILNEDAADKEGKTFGDEYLADLDYIDVCENQKEGYESGAELSDDDYKQSDEEDKSDNEDDDDFKCSLDTSHQRGRSATDSNDNESRSSRERKRMEDRNKKRYSIREDFFGEDFCYSLDAKKMGNIGRYLNHSCEPNCFVQNVFIDTHDLRFPWVSFFAKKDILAYEELSWDYNYEIGCIDNRKMLCFCGAHRCRKRLL